MAQEIIADRFGTTFARRLDHVVCDGLQLRRWPTAEEPHPNLLPKEAFDVRRVQT